MEEVHDVRIIETRGDYEVLYQPPLEFSSK